MSTQQISCPACRRVLKLPDDATNRVVQCPACKQTFHPAEASPASIRAAIPKPAEFRGESNAPASAAPRPPMPPPPQFDSGERPSRRKKKDTEDLCPRCGAFVPQGVNRCPECKAEFEPEEEFKPWEEAGLERRDSEPHRGTLLLFMGIGSILLPLPFCIPILGLITNLFSLGMSIATVMMATRDMRKMDNHEMDRMGRGTTQGAQICAIIGLLLAALGLVASAVITIQVLLD